jgi:hypothetical protein
VRSSRNSKMRSSAVENIHKHPYLCHMFAVPPT